MKLPVLKINTIKWARLFSQHSPLFWCLIVLLMLAVLVRLARQQRQHLNVVRHLHHEEVVENVFSFVILAPRGLAHVIFQNMLASSVLKLAVCSADVGTFDADLAKQPRSKLCFLQCYWSATSWFQSFARALMDSSVRRMKRMIDSKVLTNTPPEVCQRGSKLYIRSDASRSKKIYSWIIVAAY